MDKRFNWPVHPKPKYSDLPYHAAYLPYRGAVAGGGVPYYIHSPHANKNFSRIQHGYHTGTSRPHKYHKPPPSHNAYTGRRTGGAPVSGGASSNSPDVVTLIVDNNNLKRLIVLHVNMLQEQSDKLTAKNKEIEEQNLKINKLFAQNDELTRTQARLEAELIEVKSQLHRKQQRDDHHHEDDDDDDEDDDDDNLPKPPAKIVHHVGTQTDFDLELPEPKRLKAINADQEIAEQNHLYLQQRQQQLHREQHKSQAERLVAEQVRPEPQTSLAQLMQANDNQPHLLPPSNANQCEVPNVLVTSVTNLSPATPIDARSKVGRGEYNGKKVSTMFLHRVNQDSSLSTTTTTSIISSNRIEKLDQMQVNHAEEEVHMKVQEQDQEHETSKVEMFNDVETHEMEVVSETIVGAEEEVVEEEVVEEVVIHEETQLDEQLVEQLVETTEHMENDLAKQTEKLVEEQSVETDQSIEHHLVEKEQIVDEQMVEKEEQVVEEQLMEEEQIVEEEQVVDQEQVVDHEQVVEEQVVEEQVVEEQVVEEQVVEEQVMEEQVMEEQGVEDHLLEQQVAEEQEIHTTDANGHMELDEEEEIKVNNVDAHSPHPGENHQIFGLNATDSPSAHSTPNHQLKKQLQIADEEDQQQGQLVQDGQVEMEVSTLEYFTDDGTQDDFEIHSEQVVTIETQTEEPEISNDFRISPTTTNDTQAAPKSVSVPAPSTPPPAPQNYNQAAAKTAKINSLAVAPNSKKVKKPALPSKIIANHQSEIKAHHLHLQEPLKKILKLKLRQCVLPTAKSTTAPAPAPTQQDKVTNFTHLSNDNHEISIEEQTRRKLQEHLEKQQRRQSQTPLVLLKKKSSDEVSNTSLIFPPTATTITPAPTPITTPSTTPVHTPTSSIESATAVAVAPAPLMVAAEAEMALLPTKSVTKTEEKSTQSHIAAPLTPQSISSVSSSTSTSTTTSNRKTPNNLHQTYGKSKTRSITSGGFLAVSYPYTTRSWEDQDIHCDNEFFLEEADELLADNPSLEIPKWHDTPVPASSDNKDIEPLSDADFVKRHEKYVKDEIERKRRDERFLREQIRSQELRMRHKQDEVLLPLDPLPISTFYPLPEDIEGVQFVNEVPVQVFGDNMPTLNPNDEFNLPWIEEENADTAIARAKAQAKPVSTLASKKLPTTAAEQKQQELNSSFVFIKRRKRRKAGKSGGFGGT